MSKSLKKGAGIVIVGAALAGLSALFALTNVYVIQDTEVGVKVRLGEIQPDVIETGIEITLPFFETIRRVDITEQKRYFSDIRLTTTADGATPATGNIVVNYSINGEYAPEILKDYGSVSRYIDKVLEQPTHGLANELAAKFDDTRQLMLATSRSKLAADIKEGLTGRHAGLDVNLVITQTITPHETIAGRLKRAADRSESERVEQLNKKLAATAAETAEATAIGKEKVANATARANAFRIQADADANAHSVRVAADSKRYALEQEAAGNKKLTASLTPQILRKQELDNEAVLFSASNGEVPSMIIGETDLRAFGIPVAATTGN